MSSMRLGVGLRLPDSYTTELETIKEIRDSMTKLKEYCRLNLPPALSNVRVSYKPEDSTLVISFSVRNPTWRGVVGSEDGSAGTSPAP